MGLGDLNAKWRRGHKEISDFGLRIADLGFGIADSSYTSYRSCKSYSPNEHRLHAT